MFSIYSVDYYRWYLEEPEMVPVALIPRPERFVFFFPGRIGFISLVQFLGTETLDRIHSLPPYFPDCYKLRVI